MGILKHRIKFVTGDMTEKIEACFLKELHDIVMNVFAFRILREIEYSLSAVIVVSQCRSICEGFVFYTTGFKFSNQTIPSILVGSGNIVHKCITDREHNRHHSMKSFFVIGHGISIVSDELIPIKCRGSFCFKDFA